MAELSRADPTYAAELLAEVRRNGNLAVLAILLRQMATVSEGCARSASADAARALPL
nr:addiction module antidote protein [Luteibacter anthropi]